MKYFYTKDYIENTLGMNLKEFIHTAKARGFVLGKDFSVINDDSVKGELLQEVVFEIKNTQIEDQKEEENAQKLFDNIEPATGDESVNDDGNETIIEELIEQGLIENPNTGAQTSNPHNMSDGLGLPETIIRLYDKPVLNSQSLSDQLGHVTMSDAVVGQTELSYTTPTAITYNVVNIDAIVVLAAEQANNNLAPYAAYDSFFTSTNTPISGNLLIHNGFGADIDPDGGAVFAVSGTFATAFGGSVTIMTDGSFTYTPSVGYSGADSFSYSVRDTAGATDTATVDLHVSSGEAVTAIDFSSATITSYGGSSQNVSNQSFVEDNGSTFHLENNTWKDITLNYTVTANTVIEFDFMSTSRGEIHGIGFDTNDSIAESLTFKLYGTQSWGINTYNNYAGNEGEWVHYTIDVGDRYTGTFTSLFFVNDDDGYLGANSFFSNIVIHEGGTSASETMTGTTGSQTFMGMGGDDVIYGLDGDDVLYGGSGIDFLFGGDGADTFGFDDITAIDHVQDFSIAEGDILDVSDLLVGYDPITDAIGDFVAVTSDGHDTFISVDTDGGADNFVQIAILHGVSSLSNAETLETDGTLITV